MQHIARKMWGETGWGMPTSLALHLALAFLLLVRLPELSAPAAEQSINVELVPPPKPEDKPQKDAKPARQQARPQPQAFESASAKAETETRPEPELPAVARNRAEARRELPEPSSAAPAKTESAAGERPAEGTAALPELGAETEDAVNRTETAALAPQAPPVPREKPVPNEAKPDPTQKPADTASERQANRLTQARELYSKDAMSDPRVKQAIGRLPPKKRITQLCLIEALEQVRRQRPGAFPDMFGAGGLVSETGVNGEDGAFRSRGKWYAFDFKCEVDAEKTSVTSFSYAIGQAIPESEWSKRKLPKN